MKIFKLIFSRVFLVCIAIAIEFAFIILSLNFWQDAYSWLKTIITCLGVIMFFNLINRQQLPEMKIPWLVCFMTFPLFGVTLYILISNNKPTRRQLKIINKTLEKQPINSNRVIEPTDENSHLLGIEEYLHTTTKSYGYSNSDIHFLSSGEMFWQDLLDNLRTATNFIFMEYFIIQKGIMWNSIYEILTERVKQGVEVFILYDDIGTAGKLPANFARKLRKAGIKCRKFNPFIPLISGIHNNRDHRKITIIDGK
ncbi:MAG: cardiolipin synthase, partial [Eubacteriales bacterium]|nr:cardiolipin synthase [Eubacteriales bacterium]